MYFKQVCFHIYQALGYLKSHDKFYEGIPIANNLSNEDIFTFNGGNIIIVQRRKKKVISSDQFFEEKLFSFFLRVSLAKKLLEIFE